MLELISLFVVKILDNLISTAKSITVYKNKEILSSVLVIISQFLFYFVIKQVILDSSMLSIIIASVASGLGTYMAMKINNKFQKDMLYMNIITCKNKDDIESLCNYLIKNKIKYIVNDSYTRSWDTTYSAMIFSNTKEQSKLIDKFINETDTKYLRQIIK